MEMSIFFNSSKYRKIGSSLQLSWLQ